MNRQERIETINKMAKAYQDKYECSYDYAYACSEKLYDEELKKYLKELNRSKKEEWEFLEEINSNRSSPL